MKAHINNIFKVFFILVTAIGLLYLYSEFDTYHPAKPLHYHGSMVEPFKNEGVHVTATVYDSIASWHYLDKNLLSYGYQPVQITVQNNTAHTYYFSTCGVNLPSASSKEVVSSITSGSIPRAIAFRVASFFFWPLIIPSTIDTIKTWHTHSRLKHDYYAKSVKDCKEPILPYSSVHRILFVPKNGYKDLFSVKLQNAENKSVHSFPVHQHAVRSS